MFNPEELYTVGFVVIVVALFGFIEYRARKDGAAAAPRKIRGGWFVKVRRTLRKIID